MPKETAAPKTGDRSVEIYVVQEWGNIRYRPVNQVAKDLALLARQMTFTHANLLLLMKLGFSVDRWDAGERFSLRGDGTWPK